MSLPHGSVTEVCYVTEDIEQAANRWANITGAGPFYLMMAPETEMNYRGAIISDTITAALGFSGTTLVEFIQPNANPSIFKEVMDAKGDGAVHHVMPNIRPITGEQYDALCKDYDEAGIEKVLSFNVPDLGRNCFYDARDKLGVFLEVLEVPEHAFDMVNLMYRSHQSRAGQKPFQGIADLFAT